MSAIPRIRQPWESMVISVCIVVVAVVLTICACIFLIELLSFGIAQLQAHKP